MRTITVTYLDGTPDLVIDADSWDTDTDDMFVFRADGRLVALVPSRNVRHIVSDATHEDKVREAVEQTVIAPDDAIEREKVRKLRAALRLPVSSERVYDASVVSAECSTGPYASDSLTLTTPVDPGVWVRIGSDTAAIRAFAADAAREFGFATVGEIRRGGISTDVESGRTTRTWHAEVK